MILLDFYICNNALKTILKKNEGKYLFLYTIITLSFFKRDTGDTGYFSYHF